MSGKHSQVLYETEPEKVMVWHVRADPHPIPGCWHGQNWFWFGTCRLRMQPMGPARAKS
jgi:hypothetical protein